MSHIEYSGQGLRWIWGNYNTFRGFGGFGRILKLYVGIAVHKQYNLLDTIFNYIFHLETPGKYLCLSPKSRLSFSRRSRPWIVGFLDLFIDISLEVPNEKYRQILYLIDYIAYGQQFPHKFWNSPKSA